MDCRETQALLTAFHDGELPAADRARVEGHLRGCPECRASWPTWRGRIRRPACRIRDPRIGTGSTPA